MGLVLQIWFLTLVMCFGFYRLEKYLARIVELLEDEDSE